MYRFESWTIKKFEHQRIDAFKLWCWRRLLRVPWTARRANQSILKEINPEYSLEGLMLKLKLQYFGHLMRRAESLEKTDAEKDWGQEKGATEDEMVGWHHWLDGHEFKQTPRDGDGQGSLVCCSPWGHKESDMTKWLNNYNIRSINICWMNKSSLPSLTPPSDDILAEDLLCPSMLPGTFIFAIWYLRILPSWNLYRLHLTSRGL